MSKVVSECNISWITFSISFMLHLIWLSALGCSGRPAKKIQTTDMSHTYTQKKKHVFICNFNFSAGF